MPRNKRTLGGVLTQHPKLIVAFFLLATIVFGYFTRYFQIDASAETLLVKDNPLYIQSRIIDQRFAPDEFVLVGFKPANGDIFSDQSLQTIASLAEEFRQLDRVATVNSVINVPLLSLAGGLNTDLNPATYTWEQQQYSADQLREVFTNHPIYSDLLVSADLSATAIQIVFEKHPEAERIDAEILALQRRSLDAELSTTEQTQLNALQQSLDTITQELSRVRSQEIESIYASVDRHSEQGEFYLGGNYVLVEHLINIIQNDLLLFGSAIALTICVLLVVLFRDIWWLGIPILCCAVSIVITVGLFGMLELKTTVISSNFIALQLILTLALVIHLIVQYQNLAQQANDNNTSGDHLTLLQQTIDDKLLPCVYAGLTTSVGFAALLFSGLQPVITFGWMMIIAVLMSILISLVLFPGILALAPRVLAHQQHAASLKLLDFFDRLCMKRPFAIIVCGVAVLIISVVGITRLDVENSFLDYFKDTTQVHRELRFIDQDLGGSTPFDIVYTINPASNDPDLIISAEDVQRLQQIQYSLAQSSAVGKTLSIVNFTELARSINGDQPLTEYELTSLYRLLDSELRDDLLGAYFDEASGQVRIGIRIKDTTENLNRENFLVAVKATLQEIGLSENDYTLGNLFVLYQDILQRLYSSQITTLGLVFIALAIVLCVIFRSVKVALIALLPNIIASLSVLGVMGWFGIPLDLMTITIASIAMGIAVDDTIHFVHGYLQHLANGSEKPVYDTLHSVGHALLYTTAIIAMGFSVLGFSDFVPSMLFGLLTAFTMLVALLTGLSLLPVLLARFVRS